MTFHLSEGSIVTIILFIMSYLIIGAGIVVKLMVTQSNLKRDVVDLKEDRTNVREAVVDLCSELHELREAFIQAITELKVRAEE